MIATKIWLTKYVLNHPFNIIHILSTNTRMLSTENLAMRNRRVDEVPSEAGDFARIVNGSLFSLNGGRSSESTFDLNRGHLYWITSVLNQFDKTQSAPIKFSQTASIYDRQQHLHQLLYTPCQRSSYSFH